MNKQLVTFIKLGIGILLIAVLFLWFIEEPQKLLNEILNADKRLLILGTCAYSAAVAIGGLKWGKLLQASGIDFSWRRLLSYQWLAEFFNNFLPTQAGGDVVRGYALASDTQRRGVAAASVLLDRFVGLSVFMIGAAIASLGMLLFGHPSGRVFGSEELLSIRLIALGSAATSLGLLLAVALLLSQRLRVWVQRVLTALPLSQKSVPIWTSLGAAFHDYRAHGSALFWVTLGSISIVLLTSINIWLISEAIDPGSIGLVDVIAINPIIVFVLLIVPFIPGGLGVRQATFAGTFALLGFSWDLGFAVGLIQQAIGYLVSLPGGYIWVRGRNEAEEIAVPSSNNRPSVA